MCWLIDKGEQAIHSQIGIMMSKGNGAYCGYKQSMTLHAFAWKCRQDERPFCMTEQIQQWPDCT